MATEWIRAAHALRMAEAVFPTDRAKLAIWTAAYGGQVHTRAERLLYNDHPRPSARIPAPFWKSLGLSGCAADWATGHFMAMTGTDRWQAFGVEFVFEDIMELLPVERRAAAVANSSVVGDSAFVSASTARKLIYTEAGINPASAGRFIIERCRMGLIGGRAVQMLATRPARTQEDDERNREWDIPLWFWNNFTKPETSSQDWSIGTFKGIGLAGDQRLSITLRGVGFAKSGLSLFVPSLRVDGEQAQDPTLALPRLPESDLQKWWNAKKAVRNLLSQDELLTLARAAFPDNHVARDRIRALAAGRKRGPRGIGDKSAAE